jgi:hypothetical protein
MTSRWPVVRPTVLRPQMTVHDVHQRGLAGKAKVTGQQRSYTAACLADHTLIRHTWRDMMLMPEQGRHLTVQLRLSPAPDPPMSAISLPGTACPLTPFNSSSSLGGGSAALPAAPRSVWRSPAPDQLDSVSLLIRRCRVALLGVAGPSAASRAKPGSTLLVWLQLDLPKKPFL